jgi:cytochrome c biogenesis protein CcmG/thiol:disulfide interchange protein DsbE
VPRRPILFGLLLAAVATLAVVLLARPPAGDQRAATDQPAPAFAGTTLDGAAFDLAAHRGSPVLINFWGPSCVPCRDEFPLLAAKVAEHAPDGLVVVGVLTDDPPDPARAFATEYGATWPTVMDPDKAIKTAYRVAARPQTYFVDSAGIIRSIQVGGLTDAEFERQYARIAP